MKPPAPLIDPVGRAAAIDALLPQTQCTQCGFDGCAPYAVAIADEGAAINRCPPGGTATIAALSRLLDTPPLPLDVTRGQTTPRLVARIIEPLCIGCTLCIQACPVDAIVGAPKRMHAVIIDHCTGCELCVAPCPVDCIEMIGQGASGEALAPWSMADADAARRRTRQRARRLQRVAARGKPATTPEVAEVAEAVVPVVPVADSAARRQAMIESAVARARERLARRSR
jgi:electron transport complex protein RnfB